MKLGRRFEAHLERSGLLPRDPFAGGVSGGGERRRAPHRQVKELCRAPRNAPYLLSG